MTERKSLAESVQGYLVESWKKKTEMDEARKQKTLISTLERLSGRVPAECRAYLFIGQSVPAD